MTEPAFLAIVLVLAVIVVAVVRIVPERSRYAIFKEGRFIELKGPGLLVKLPGRPDQWVCLSVDDKANMIDVHLAAINGVNVPIESEKGKASGSGMRITGFRDNKVLIGSETT